MWFLSLLLIIFNGQFILAQIDSSEFNTIFLKNLSATPREENLLDKDVLQNARGLWEDSGNFLQKITSLFDSPRVKQPQITNRRKDDIKTPPPKLKSGLKPELLPPQLAFESNKITTTLPPVIKPKITRRPIPNNRPNPNIKHKLVPGRYRRPVLKPSLNKQNKNSAKIRNSDRIIPPPPPKHDIAPQIDTKRNPSSLQSSPFLTRFQNNFLETSERPKLQNTAFVNFGLNKGNLVRSKPFNQQNNVKPKQPSIFDDLTNMASNIFSPSVNSNELPKEIANRRTPPQPHRIIIGPDERVDKLKDFKPSPQQGLVAADAFQPLFVASPSLDNMSGFPNNLMKPMKVSQSKIVKLPEKPSSPIMQDFF